MFSTSAARDGQNVYFSILISSPSCLPPLLLTSFICFPPWFLHFWDTGRQFNTLFQGHFDQPPRPTKQGARRAVENLHAPPKAESPQGPNPSPSCRPQGTLGRSLSESGRQTPDSRLCHQSGSNCNVSNKSLPGLPVSVSPSLHQVV